MPARLRAKALLASLRQWWEVGDDAASRRFLASRYPGEVAALFPLVEKVERDRLFDLVMGLSDAAGVLGRTDADVVGEQIRRLPEGKALDVLRRLPADVATAALRDQPQERQRLLAAKLATQSHVVVDLLARDEETAGGHMDRLPAIVRDTATVGDALARLKAMERDEWALAVYVVDGEGRLLMSAGLRTLMNATPDTPIGEVASPAPMSVAAGDDKEEAIKVFDRYDLFAVPVVDEEGILVGLLTVDDVFDLVQEEATEDAFLMAGLDEDELDLAKPPWKHALRRFSWLSVTILGSLVSGAILQRQGAEMAEAVVMMAFVPVVMAMGGAMGNQSAVIVVRSIATGRLEPGRPGKFMARQVATGLIMAALAALVVLLVGRFTGLLPPAYVAVVTVSLAAALAGGTIIGAGIPLAMSRLGVDPAIASAPLISTLCDITGVTVYTLLLAAWL
ncbi:magnesium transporter [bacterium]|nr:magnesium transporter [bacterium]